MSIGRDKVIAFPSPTDNVETFDYDLTLEVTEKLSMGFPISKFSDREIACMKTWAGEDHNGTFFDPHITSTYGIEVEDGHEPGQYTWPKLAELFLQRKTRAALQRARVPYLAAQ